jgi:glucose-6-phosphate dehydrogenase assembly protein OpcA
MVTSLLLPDLPVFLVWLAPPDFDRPLFRELCVGVTRLVTDAARFPGTLDALPALSRRTIPRLTDLAWTELTGWRELVAQLFDIPDHAALLPSITEIRVRHHAGSDAQARLLAGWIESRTGRGAQVGLEPVDASVERPGALEAVEIVCGDALFRVERQDEDIAVMTSPELPDQHRTLPVLDLPELLAAELDVHDADPVFVEALAAATDLWR